MKMLITPSILSADLSHLQNEIDSVASADWLQVDVMDGHFVPNLSFGAPVLKTIKTTLPLDVHLMVSNPADRIAEFAALGVKNITFHAEAVPETKARKALIQAIHAAKATAGIALNPETPVSAIDDVIADIDLVLIMSVHPGFGGQKFIPATIQKLDQLSSKCRARGKAKLLEVDGGIDESNARAAVVAGANVLVAGTSIFKQPNVAEALRAIRSSTTIE